MPSVSLSEPLDRDFMSIDNAINTSVVSSVTNGFDNNVLSVFSETKGNSQSDDIPTPGPSGAQSSRPLGDYKIPKKTQRDGFKRKLSANKETTVVSLEGFDSEEDEDQWFDDEDDMDDHDDFNGEELPKAQKKRELSSDESDSDLADGDFACFDPAGKKKRRLQTIQKSYVKKMFSKLIKAEDLDESLEKIGVEVPNDPRLTSKELDQNLLDALPFNTKKFVVRSDNTLRRVEYRLLRATGPSLTLWNKLKDARDAKKSRVDISELITLAEASVCTIGQAELELKFQRRLQVATKFLRNPKKAKKVITLNNDILEGEKSQLFGNVFTKKLVGNLKDTAKLRTALREATSRPRFDGGYNSRGRASGGYNQRGRGGGSHQQPFRGGPRGGRRGGGGRGRGRGGAQTGNRYVQTVYSKVKRSFSECKSKKSSKKRSGFRNRFINSCVFHYRPESSDTVTQPGPDPCSGGKQERGQTVSLHPELADCNSRSVDSGSSRGKTNLVVRNTLPKQNTQRAKLQPSDELSYENRNSENVRLWSNRGMSGLKPTIHKHNVSEVQERWGVSSNFQLEKAQPVHGIPAFQVRGHPSPSRHCTTDGLDVQDRSKECLLDGTTSSKRQTLVSVDLGKQTVPIQSVAIRTGASAQMVHKTNEASSGFIEKTRNEECDLHGRSLGWRSGDGGSSFSSSPDKETSRISGVCSERGEVSHIPTKDCRVSGFHSGLRAHDTDATKTEDLKNSASLQGSAQKTQNISEGSSKSSRPISGSSKSSITSPLTLQTATNGSNISTAKEPTKIQCTNDPQQREQRRATMVDRELRRLEWQIVHQDSYSKQARDRDRRIQQRMGSHLQRNNNTRQMDPTGNKTPYQRKGVTRSVNSCKSFHKGESGLSCPSENGQHNDSSTNCEDGLNKVQKSLQVDHGSVGILLAEQHHTDSGTSKGSVECESRSRIEGFQGLQQLETETPDLPDNNQDMGASGDRSICGQDKLPVEEIHQLETRSTGNRNRCLHSELDRNQRICFPTNMPHKQMSEQSVGGTNTTDHNYAYVARSAMVCKTSTDVHRRPDTAPANAGPVERPHRRKSSSSDGKRNDNSGMESVRQNARNPKLSTRAKTLLGQKLAPRTRKTYESPWKRWCCWCNQQSLDPISTSVENVANFIAEEQTRLSYSALNTTRSAISAYHDKVDGVPVGQHELIKDIMECAYKNKPSLPKYKSTWDVNKVLQFIKELGPNAGLDLRTLTLKLTMLMSLVSADRGQELQVLDISNLRPEPDRVVFEITERTKTGRKLLEFPRYDWSENLDVVTCLETYLVATQTKRTENTSSQLLISFQAPHKPVTTSTIARWLKTIMEMAGIDTNTYKAHSTRAASTSKAKAKGMSTKQILSLANWSNAKTFLRYYNKSIDGRTEESNFANLVLSWGSFEHAV